LGLAQGWEGRRNNHDSWVERYDLSRDLRKGREFALFPVRGQLRHRKLPHREKVFST
jgi:hypothetical protein